MVVGEAPLTARTADVAATVEEEDDAAANLPGWGSGEAAGAVCTASALEMAGLQPLLVVGSAHNFKVTYPQDFALAQAVLTSRSAVAQKEIP